MADTKQQVKNCITLKGSALLVKEYLSYGINSVLFQRGIFPSETFTTTEQFGLTIFMSTDDKIMEFLQNVLNQVEEWLVMKKMQQMSLVIMKVATQEVLERWDFKVEYEADLKENAASATNTDSRVGNKDLKIIQKEIRDVLRQISATVSFLPLLDCQCSFDLLIYTVPDVALPERWSESEPCFIANSQEIKLRTFSTSVHRMDTHVSYKVE